MSTILIFILVLSVLVLVHEIGHLAAAKFFNIKVEEFGLGLPPRLFTIWRKSETRYSINLLPIGGFVRLHGENVLEDSPAGQLDPARSFYHQSAFKKIIVLVAGVTMNYSLGLLLIMTVFFNLGQPVIKNSLEIQSVNANSPAAQSDLQTGDLITGYQNQIANESDDWLEIETNSAFIRFVEENQNQPIRLLLIRQLNQPDEQELRLLLMPRSTPPPNEGPLGIVISEMPFVRYEPIAWFNVPAQALIESNRLIQLMVGGLGNMVYELVSQGVVPEDITGPIGIAKLTGQIAEQGFFSLLQFTALISINLAVINLLPLPALDGGRLFFVLVETVSGRKINPRYENWIHAFGMILLLILVGLISIRDYQRFFIGKP